MAEITFKGNKIHTDGNLPAVGKTAPDFKLVQTDLNTITMENLKGKKTVLNIFVSIDTPVCQASLRKFNEHVSQIPNAVAVNVSLDLPFAFKRFCGAEGLSNVLTGSDYLDHSFAKNYGVKITDGPLAGLLSRAVVVIDENGKVVHTEQVPEIAQEPNYDAALKALKEPSAK